MKKTLIALSVLVAAGSVNAATIYENEGSSIAVSGEINGYYKNVDKKTPGGALTKSETSRLYSDGNVQFDVAHEINSDLKAIASFEFDYETKGNAEGDDVWVGLTGDFGTVKVGETGSPYAVLEASHNDYKASNVSQLADNTESDGQGVRYSNDFGPVSVSGAYFFTTDAETSAAGIAGEQEKGTFELGLEYSADMFTVGTAFYTGERELTTKAVDTQGMGLAASVNVGPAKFAASYTKVEAGKTELKSAIVDANTFGVLAKFDVSDDLNVYAVYQKVDADKGYDGAGVKTNSDLTESSMYFGTAYALAPKVFVKAEYNVTEAKTGGVKDKTNQLALGLQVKF